MAGARPNNRPQITESAAVTAQHVPVQFRVQRKVLLPVGEQKRQRSHAPDRKQDPECSAERRQHHTLGKQLPHDAEPSRSQAEPDSHFAASRGGPCQQQIGDVRARDRQDQSHHRQQHVQRPGILAAQTAQTGGAGIQNQRGQFGALTVGGRGGGNPLMETRRQRCLRLGHAYAGTQTAHHFDPVEVSVGIHTGRPGAVHEQIRVQRKIEVRRRRWIDSEEFRRRHADHREGHVIDENRLSNRTRRSPKALLAGGKTDYRDRRRAWTVVFGIDQTSRGGRHFQAAKILAGDVLRAGAGGLPSDGQGLVTSVEVSEQRGKDGILLAKRLANRQESPVWENAQRPCRLCRRATPSPVARA